MSKMRSLAGQTAIYGVSSILGRLLNYALVPLHTAIFPDSSDLGVVTGLYAYTAIFLVIYTFGMETAFFRFSTKDNLEDTYHPTASYVIFVSTLLSVLIIIFSDTLALWAGYPDASLFIIWLAIILWIDSLLAIPFARLRLENKARIFAAARIINIVINVGLQVIFLYGIPYVIAHNWPGSGWIGSIYNENLGIGYIFLANLIANIFLIFILWKWISKIKIVLNWARLKPILFYALPILITGIAGMFNEQLDKILLEQFLPNDFYNNMDSTAALGVYGQTFKLSIFMMLAIQAFRYAGEPFFFSNAQDKKAPELFARVMHYFVLLSLLIFVLVSINVDLIGFIFLRNPEYRIALYLVPILLLGKLFYGVYMNLSIWFKLTDQTIYGMYFSIIGAIVTIAGNIMLIPVIGYTGSAITSVLCYFLMATICYFVGNRKYPVPYKFKILIVYLISACGIVYLVNQVRLKSFFWDSTLNIGLSLAILCFVYFREKPKLIKKSS